MALQAATHPAGQPPEGSAQTMKHGDEDLVWAALIVIFAACFIAAAIALNQ